MAPRANKADVTTRRRLVHNYLQANAVNGKFMHGSITKAASIYQCSRKMVARVWAERADLAAISFGGRPQRWTSSAIRAAVGSVPLHERTSLRAVEAASTVSKSTLARCTAESENIRRTRITTKPLLSPEHMIKRLEFTLSFVRNDSRTGEPVFVSMYVRVHIDEKWFVLKEEGSKVYITADEEKPYTNVVNKQHVTKVMFLVAVARPRWDYGRNAWFDGKLGCWPIVDRVAAKRTSKYCAAGDMATKLVNVTSSIYEKILVEKLLPAIKSKWPGAIL